MAGRPRRVDRRGHQHGAGARQGSPAFLAVLARELGRRGDAEKCSHRGSQCGMGPVLDRTGHPNQVIAARKAGGVAVQLVENRSHPTFDPVPHHRVSHRAWDCVGELRALGGIGPDHQPDRPSASSLSVSTKLLERTTAREPLDHADRRARPFWRRDRRTARPPRVLIRERKPCFLARLRTLGWYGRFMSPPGCGRSRAHRFRRFHANGGRSTLQPTVRDRPRQHDATSAGHGVVPTMATVAQPRANDTYVISSSISVIWSTKTTADLGKCGNPQPQLATGHPVDRFAALPDGLRVVEAPCPAIVHAFVSHISPAQRLYLSLRRR